MNTLDFKNVKPKILKGNRDGPNWYSGKGQDSFIKHIFDTIGTTNKFCVEFGSGDGYNASNTLYLEYQGWKRVMFDRNHHSPEINLHRAVLTADNICETFRGAGVPKEFDFVSVDIDGNDYWLLESLLKEFSPAVIMVETNCRFAPDVCKVMKYDPNYSWDGHSWYGASPKAFKFLAEKFGYTVVGTYLDEAFIVRNDKLHSDDINRPWEEVYSSPNIEIYAGTDKDIDESKWIDL